MAETRSDQPQSEPERRYHNGRALCLHKSKRHGNPCGAFALRKPDGTHTRGCYQHAGLNEITAQNNRHAVRHGLYGRSLRNDDERALFDSARPKDEADEAQIVADQIGLEVATLAAALERHGLPSDPNALDALARKSSVIAKLIHAAAAARAAAKDPSSAAVSINYVAPSASPMVALRGPDGPVTALPNPDDDANYLVRCADGAWRPGICKRDEELQVDVWHVPSLQLEGP